MSELGQRASLSTSIEEAASVLQDGGVIAVPTDTLYGVAASIENDPAVRRVFEAKGRTSSSPLPIFVREPDDIFRYGRCVPELAIRLAAEFWPGKLTIVVKRSSEVSDIVSGGLDTVGLRVPDHPVPREIVSALAIPMTATSANVSGQSPFTSAADVLLHLGDSLDLVFDGGRLDPSEASTVVDVSGGPRILRGGAIPRARLERVTGVPFQV